MGIDRKRLLKNPFPLISFKLTNFDFNLLQISQLAVIYGLLFLVTFGLTLMSFVGFLQDRQ